MSPGIYLGPFDGIQPQAHPFRSPPPKRNSSNGSNPTPPPYLCCMGCLLFTPCSAGTRASIAPWRERQRRLVLLQFLSFLPYVPHHTIPHHSKPYHTIQYNTILLQFLSFLPESATADGGDGGGDCGSGDGRNGGGASGAAKAYTWAMDQVRYYVCIQYPRRG